MDCYACAPTSTLLTNEVLRAPNWMYRYLQAPHRYISSVSPGHLHTR
jgi:hypothetical protein